MSKNKAISYIKASSLIILSFLLIIFPAFFLTNTTNFFVLPKQFLILTAAIILLILWALRMILENKITIQINPFNAAIGILGIIALISSFFSVNVYDSFFQSIPFVGILVLYFLFINNAGDKKSIKTAFYSFILGAVLASAISIFYGLKVYIFPISQIENQYFNSFGSTIQAIIYYVAVFLVVFFTLIPRIKNKLNIFSAESIFYMLSSLVLIVAIGVSLYQIFSNPQTVVLLPFAYGLQISFAAVSQNSQRFMQSLLLGSGYGTFGVDFSLFKLASFNQQPNIWNVAFPYSSSYALELLATTGILGALAYFFLLFKLIKAKINKKSVLYVVIFILALVSFILPLSISTLFLFFMLIAFYATGLYLEDNKAFYTVEIKLVALRKGLFVLSENANYSYDSPSERKANVLLPTAFFALILIAVLFIGFFGFKFLRADLTFAQSLKAQNQNDGQKVYDLQRRAIQDFQQRSDFHRIFSQINLALANSVSSSVPPGSSPSAQTQQTVVTLLQQSINSGRNAITLSPGLAINWENLSQIYRSLIGISENADQFAISSLEQAIAIDPTNPQLYIQLGGIYYQLNQFDAAQNQFQVAINLKPDLANAYYNLGHALEAKNDLQKALSAYQAVEQLTKNDKASNDKIKEEIKILQTRIGNINAESSVKTPETTSTDQPPLEINSPSTEINPKTQVEVPPPPKE